MSQLILASQSAIRRQLLEGVGLSFSTQTADINERAIESSLDSASPEEVASKLAIEKARVVSQANPGALVIGADQVLVSEGSLLHKAKNSAEAAEKLRKLQGQIHHLVASVALAKNGEALWSATDKAALAMRPLTEDDIAAYLASAGDAATASVGAYRLEELGAALFERIAGDYFTILGLPLLALLGALRQQGVDPIHEGASNS